MVMKTLVFASFLFLMSVEESHSQESRVMEGLTFSSSILKMDKTYSVYLPKGYVEDQRSYPVLYLLHGGGGDHTTWIQSGELKSIADRSISEGKAAPMIIVMPHANEVHKGYFNQINGGFDFEDFFFQELIPHIEKNYRVRTKSRYRAVAGQSMGGAGTIFYALHHPEMFSAAVPLSPVTESWEKGDLSEKLKRNGIKGYSQDQFDAYYLKYSIPQVLASADSGRLKAIRTMRWYVCTGDDDSLNEGISKMILAFKKAAIPHEYRVKDGSHNWSFWRQELPELLAFVSKSFTEF